MATAKNTTGTRRAPAKNTTAPKGRATPTRPRANPAAKRSVDVAPGHADFDWRTVYPAKVPLFRYEDEGYGTVLCLPPFPEPDQGSIFADLLEDVPDQVMLMKLFKQAIHDNAKDPDEGLAITSSALRNGLTSIEHLLQTWAGADTPKS